MVPKVWVAVHRIVITPERCYVRIRSHDSRRLPKSLSDSQAVACRRDSRRGRVRAGSESSAVTVRVECHRAIDAAIRAALITGRRSATQQCNIMALAAAQRVVALIRIACRRVASGGAAREDFGEFRVAEHA